MIRTTMWIAALGCLAGACLQADFSYQQGSKLTGGAMAGAMKVVGVFSKQAREPIQSAVMVKGDRMATHSGETAQIIDLGSETITDVNFSRKQYTVVTFEQMRQFMAKMAQEAGKAKEAERADVQFKVDVKDTGQQKEIAGLPTRQMVMTLEMEGRDEQTGEKGTMVMTMDTWLAPSVPGYEEVKDFYRRMAEKLEWMPSAAGMLARTSPGGERGMSALYKEAAKLDGVPVYQVTSMSAKAEGGQQAAPQQAERQEEAETPSVGGALGRLGGLGRLGRRETEEPKQPRQPRQQEPAPSQAAPGTLMEITTELTGFSAAAVDASKLQVPAGFQQVESEVQKALRK